MQRYVVRGCAGNRQQKCRYSQHLTMSYSFLPSSFLHSNLFSLEHHRNPCPAAPLYCCRRSAVAVMDPISCRRTSHPPLAGATGTRVAPQCYVTPRNALANTRSPDLFPMKQPSTCFSRRRRRKHRLAILGTTCACRV